MVIFLLALIGTLIVMAVLCVGRLGFGRREVIDWRQLFRWFIGYFIFNYVFSLLILYIALPALTGPFGGWQWVLWPLFFSSLGNLFAYSGRLFEIMEAGAGISHSSGARRSVPANASRRTIAAGIFGLIFVAVLGIAATILISIFTTWFDVNAKALAAIPRIQVDTSPNLPPTDASNIVLVSQSVAAYEGQQIIGSTGQNLGSAYNLDPSSYTLQSVNHHLYYVAPLSYNNIFANLSNPTTPGFIMVDAENPQQTPVLYTGGQSTIKYLPGALLNQDLLHHVYLSGYTYGGLVDPTLELNDSLHPYWTISLMQPSRGYTGNVLSAVLLVDAHTGAITKYSPQDVPAWVDRVMPAATVTQYLQWWGLYHAAPWFNPSGNGQQTPASDPELLYNNVDQPVWLVPMTSSSLNDNSSTGVFLFDTHKNLATFYPKAAGLGIGSNVQSTFSSTHANIRGYSVDSVQLYQIYNTPTWVAIYTQSADSGAIFQEVGMVDARELNGSNVQYEQKLSTVLSDYQQWLAQQSSSSGGGSSGAGTATQTVTGKVLRISAVPETSTTVYYLQIQGQHVIFTANLALSPKLPLVQAGDTVTVTYVNSGGTIVNLSGFDDTSINLSTGTGATATATPTS